MMMVIVVQQKHLGVCFYAEVVSHRAHIQDRLAPSSAPLLSSEEAATFDQSSEVDARKLTLQGRNPFEIPWVLILVNY